jgi:V/A-type H+-transporting ATPase subunit K
MKTLKLVLGALLMLNFAVAVTAALVVLFPDLALAAEGAATAGAGGDRGLMMIGAALAVGLGCVGAGLAVAQVGAAALGAIGEKPDMLGKTLIFVGLAEGIAIYGLIISIMIYASAG